MMPGDAGFACSCGQLKGTIDALTPSGGTHAECFCDSCRAALIHLGQPDPRPGGVHLYQTTPDRVHITQGADRLAVIRLSPRGPLRWYAACCNAPLFNTLATPGLPFVAVAVDRLDNPASVGKVRVQSFVRGKDGKQHHQGGALMVWRLVTSMGAARLSGRWRETPFFDIATGQPVAAPRVLTREEVAAARA